MRKLWLWWNRVFSHLRKDIKWKEKESQYEKTDYHSLQ